MSTPDLLRHIKRTPKTCFWEITDACNLRCIHCEADAGNRAPDELDTEEALALCKDLSQTGCKATHLTGGEPFMRKDWPIIARALSDQGISVTMISNGIQVTDKNVARMVQNGVTGVSVSLDGQRAAHDKIRRPVRSSISSYDMALAALDRLRASPLRTAVITQVHRHNISDLETMYRQMLELGIDLWQVQIAMPLGRLLKLKEEYLIEPAQIQSLATQLAELIRRDELKIAVADNIGYYSREEPTLRGSLLREETFWMGCVAGYRVVALRSNGDVKGCPSHPRSFVVGNVRKEPLEKIWADVERFGYNASWKEELLEGGCKRCPYGRMCRAGCTTMAFSVTGTVYDNPFCIQHQGRR